MNRPEFIILPTGSSVRRFLETTMSMSYIDYDLEEILATVTDALRNGNDIDGSFNYVLKNYSDLGEIYVDDGVIIRAALQSLLCDLQKLIEVHRLREPNGLFNYVFHNWQNPNYDAIFRCYLPTSPPYAIQASVGY